MRAAPLFVAFGLLAPAHGQAETVPCGPGLKTQFEVWGETLPAADYLDAYRACFVQWDFPLRLPPSLPAPSPWLDSQREAYTNALKKERVDILVAPFLTQGYGLERTERGLMSADLAYHFDPATRVSDPFLTARALGEGARRYERSEIVELARAVGAHTAVVGYVGHDRAHRMTVTIQVLKLDATGALTSEVLQRDWRGVPFTDVDPPFVVFHRMLPSVLESLSLPRSAQAAQRTPPAFPDEASFSLTDLAADEAPIGPSLGLSLLGAVTSSADERSRERLFERVLVTSWHLDAPGDDATFLRAYALLNLEHRPAALALINGSNTPQSVTLRALLNGDLPGAAAALPKVANPLKRLLLAVQVDDLRHQYEREDVPQAADAKSVFGDLAVDWLTLVESRSQDLNQWQVDPSAALKFLLDEVHPVAGLDVQSVLGGGLIVGGPVDEVAVDIATVRHARRFVETAAVPVCCSAATARANAWDLVAVLEGRAEARMGKYLHLTTVVRGAPNTSGDAIARYERVFDGNPLFALARADYALEMSQQPGADTLKDWQGEAREQAAAAASWSPGQNLIAHRSLSHFSNYSPVELFIDAYGLDYPRRAYWPNYLLRFNYGRDTKVLGEIYHQNRAQAMAYARTGIEAFADVKPTMAEEDKRRMRAEIAPRFVGHPRRPALLAALRPSSERPADPIADMMATLAEDPDNWGARFSLGRTLIERDGKWQEAAELLLAHPHFHRETPPNRVKVSNDAYDAGSLFYWGGQQDLAIPFYEVAAKLDTGAASEMTSEIRLDILAGRYQPAAAASLRRAQRYPNAYAFRDFISFLHAFGYGEEAWDGFSQVATEFDNPQIWVSALVGQRREGLSESEIRAWLKQPGIRDAKFRNNLFAPRYAVLVNASDHETPEDLGALVAELEGEPAGRVVSPGLLERPHPENASQTTLVSRSKIAASAPNAPRGTPVKSEFAFFGSAYSAIRHGRFGDAVREFTAMATHYPIEDWQYSFVLPYFAWASAKTGDPEGLEQFLKNYRSGQHSFDFDLALAFFHGARKETAPARELLEKALRKHPFTDHRPVLIEYQYAEACEWLYEETGDPGFIDLLLAWATSQQIVQPTHAWPYAMEFTYARDPKRRLRALAMTLHLDPSSPRIRSANAQERAEAEAWGAANNPFLQEADPAEADGPTAQTLSDRTHEVG